MISKINCMALIEKASPYIKKGMFYLKQYGIRCFVKTIIKWHSKKDIYYNKWYNNHVISDKDAIEQQRKQFTYAPKVSIVVPVYNTPEEFLKQMIFSVKHQTYRNWELCIANASPDNETVKKILMETQKDDKRILVIDVPENEGISQNTNQVLKIATGEYIGLLDHDDLLARNTLYECVAKLNENCNMDMVYTDEDKISSDSKRHFAPNFKPDFNLDLLRSNNYICHFFIAKTKLIMNVGGFRTQFDGAQDYDLFFRCIEQAKMIGHVPQVLYHWRMHDESTSKDPGSKMYAYDAGKKAIEEHLLRCSVKGEVESKEDLGFYRVRYNLAENPLVSIIVVYKEPTKQLSIWLKHILSKTDYKNYEIVLVRIDNYNRENFLDVFGKIFTDKIKIIPWEKKFNLSLMYNEGVKHAKGEYFLFLDNRVKIIHNDWMSELLSHCQRKEVGAVGAKLYNSDNTIWHGGIVLGINNVAGNAFEGIPRDCAEYMHRASIQMGVSAVTIACMMVKRNAFEEVGGFEKKLARYFNDVDLCMKMKERGWIIVYNPYVELYYHSSIWERKLKHQSRRWRKDADYIRGRWNVVLRQGDPAYNSNLTLKKSGYLLKMR